MSGEQVVGHVSWSPDFESGPPNKIQKLLDDGVIKFAPRWSGEKLVSVDLVAADPAPQEEAVDLRPHREKVEEIFSLISPDGQSEEISFTYTNWKGETKERRAVFTLLQWGCNEWHKEPQLLIYGYDLDKKAPRTYAAKDISNVKRLRDG